MTLVYHYLHWTPLAGVQYGTAMPGQDGFKSVAEATRQCMMTAGCTAVQHDETKKKISLRTGTAKKSYSKTRECCAHVHTSPEARNKLDKDKKLVHACASSKG